MAEKSPAFTVTDRRKFTADGDLREDSSAPAAAGSPPAPAATPGPPEFGASIAQAVHPAPGQFGAHADEAVHPAPGQFGAHVAEAVHPAPGQPAAPGQAVHPAPGQFGAHVAAEPQPAPVQAVHPAPGQFGSRVVTMPAPAAPAPPAAQSSAVTNLAASAVPPPQDLQDPVEDLGEEGDALPQPTAAESAEQHAAYQESSQQLDDMLRQSNPGMKAPGVVTIEHVFQSIYLSAVVAMGAAAEPGQKPRIDIIGARQSIDMLSVLEEKTRGNLSDKEQRLAQNMLFEVRMMFLEITNAIAQQAQNPPPGKR